MSPVRIFYFTKSQKWKTSNGHKHKYVLRFGECLPAPAADEVCVTDSVFTSLQNIVQYNSAALLLSQSASAFRRLFLA